MARIILFNKPCGVLSQFTDGQGRQTLADFIDQAGVYPAGRLDRDSEGLLLLTDDGQWQHRLANPRHKTWKRYWIQVEGQPDDDQLQPLRDGLELNDGPTRPAQARLIDEPPLWPRTPPIRYRANIPTQWIEVCIREGRNRQVRRMSAAIGFPTLRLVRMAIGDWQLGDLQPGQWQAQQVKDLARPSDRPSPGKRRRGHSRRPK